jgi:transposase-like protein
LKPGIRLDGDELERLGKLGRLGAQLVFQRAIEEEVERFLRRARFERTPEARGSRNGHRPRQIATAEGPLTIAVPQIRDSLSRFVSSIIPDCRTSIRTRPLEALVIGAYVRGLSTRASRAWQRKLASAISVGLPYRASVRSCATASGLSG